MPYSYVLLPGDGVTTNFNFNFGYLAKAHIHASVDTVDTSYTWLTDFSVQITPAPAAGTVVEIRRRTPLNEPIVDWTDGTVLTEGDMDLNTRFSLYAAQEAQDSVDASVSQNSEGVFDGQGRSTTNFADPEDGTGLVTKDYFDSVYTPQLEQTITDANTAIDAKVSEATTQASNAASSASTAQGYAIAADSSADLAAALLATFKGQYLGPFADAPTVDGNGNPLTEGDLYFNTTFRMLKVYDGTAWLNAGATVEGTIAIPDEPVVATAGQTVVPVPGEYDPGLLVVYLNGSAIWPPDVDLSDSVNIVFTEPLAAGDEVTWIAFGAFDVANAIPADGSVTDSKVSPSSKLSNRIGDTVSVKDFGAVGDGATDDTAAMQGAHDTGRLVYYPAGVYKFTTITMERGGIIGDGPGSTKLVTSDLSASDVITFTGTDGIYPPVFRDFQIDPGGIKTGGAGILFAATSSELAYAVIDNVSIYNIPTGINFRRAAHFKMTNCHILNYSLAGVIVANENNMDSGDSLISGCLFNTGVSSGTRYAIYHESSAGLRIADNKILGGTGGYVGDYKNTNQSGPLLIVGNSIENVAGNCIYIGRHPPFAGAFGGIVIVGNELAVSSNGITTDTIGGLVEITVTGNYINLNNATGTAVSFNGVDKFIISGNTFIGGLRAVDIAPACTNGKIGHNVYKNQSDSTPVSNGSASTFLAGDTQFGTLSVNASASFGAIFHGVVDVTFAKPFLTLPIVHCNAGGAAGIAGGFCAYATNVTKTGFKFNLASADAGTTPNNNWSAVGII